MRSIRPCRASTACSGTVSIAICACPATRRRCEPWRKTLTDSPNIRRLEELFPRYWDSALTSSELEEFEAILRADPEARECFLLLSMQVVAPVELSALVTQLPPAPAPEPAPVRLSRRRVVQY